MRNQEITRTLFRRSLEFFYALRAQCEWPLSWYPVPQTKEFFSRLSFSQVGGHRKTQQIQSNDNKTTDLQIANAPWELEKEESPGINCGPTDL